MRETLFEASDYDWEEGWYMEIFLQDGELFIHEVGNILGCGHWD